MTHRTHAIAFALAAALVAPAAFAQSDNRPQTDERTRDALLNTNAPPPAQRLNEATPPPMDEIEEEAMEPAKRPPPRGEAAAGANSAVVQHAAWAELDTNGDGRISVAEGGVDADFKANFEMMDADHDGFVSDVEYRAHAKAGRQGEDDASRHDPTLHDDRDDTSRDKDDD